MVSQKAFKVIFCPRAFVSDTLNVASFKQVFIAVVPQPEMRQADQNGKVKIAAYGRRSVI